MTPRLLRALQRGGVTAEIRADVWGIWRAPDRRGRVIGTVSGADIDILRLQKNLKPLGADREAVLVWAGETGPATEAPQMDAAALTDTAHNSSPLLEAILRKTPSPDAREALRRACEQFRHDLEHASHSAGYVTMNWARLGAEARSTTPSPWGGSMRSRGHQAAQARLASLAEQVSDADLSILELTVIRELTRRALAKTLGLRPALAERRVSAVLQTLVEHYETRVSIR